MAHIFSSPVSSRFDHEATATASSSTSLASDEELLQRLKQNKRNQRQVPPPKFLRSRQNCVQLFSSGDFWLADWRQLHPPPSLKVDIEVRPIVECYELLRRFAELTKTKGKPVHSGDFKAKTLPSEDSSDMTSSVLQSSHSKNVRRSRFTHSPYKENNFSEIHKALEDAFTQRNLLDFKIKSGDPEFEVYDIKSRGDSLPVRDRKKDEGSGIKEIPYPLLLGPNPLELDPDVRYEYYRRMIKNKGKPKKAVRFTPDTRFYERDSNSPFWRDILARRRMRNWNKKLMAYPLSFALYNSSKFPLRDNSNSIFLETDDRPSFQPPWRPIVKIIRSGISACFRFMFNVKDKPEVNPEEVKAEADWKNIPIGVSNDSAIPESENPNVKLHTISIIRPGDHM